MSVLEARQIGGMVVSKSLKISLVATADIPAFSAATATGKPADSNNVFHKNIVIGITRAEIANGFSGYAVIDGEIDNPAWTWTAGNVIYLNGTTLSTIAPSTGFRVIVGTAVTATKIDVGIRESILLQ